ncbi:MAG: glycosyltransferase family 4 protein [Acidobacteriota bacterium]|nr:glycosyltransferase family 4 protein [Acidobacteriota bacterium]
MTDNIPGRIRVWLVSQYFPPQITAAAFRLGGLAAYLHRQGMDVTVLTSRCGRSKAAHTPADDFAGVRVLRVPVSARSHMGQYLQFLLRAGLRMYSERRHFPPRAILASSPPLSVLTIGRFLSRHAGAHLFLDIRDLWPDTPAALGRMKPGSRTFRFFKSYETRSYQHAAGISCVSRPMAARIAAQTSTPVVVAYNGVSAADLETAATLAQPQPPDESGSLRVGYFGNLGLAQGLETLLQAAGQLAAKDFQFHLIGDGVKREELRRRIQAGGLDHVHLHPARPRADLLAEAARRFQVLFINLAPQAVFSLTIPSKLFDYLLLRRPIVSGLGGEGAEILRRAGCAVCFDPADPHSLVTAMQRVSRAWRELRTNAVRNNFSLLQGFLREAQYAKIAEMIHAATAPSSRSLQTGGPA